MADQSDKTEKPTASRQQKARKEGNFPASRDLIAAVHLTVGLVLAVMVGETVILQLEQVLVSLFVRAFSSARLSSGDLVVICRNDLLGPVMYLLGKGAIVMAATLFVQVVTTGFGFSTSKLMPNLKNLNPGPRVTQLPKQNLSSALKALALLPIIGFVLYQEIAESLPAIANLAAQPLGSGLMQSREMLVALLRRLVFALLVIGIIDYVRQRQKHQKGLKMSKQEIKDEAKEGEGNQQMKQRIRQLQRAAVRRNMMKAIPKATVVIVNPTHYAIAIQYEMNSKSVPLVLAKGRNYLALAIRQKAIEHEIPIVENKPLAQALYQAVDVGQEIPTHLYRAVAEVLAYIYRTINRR